jgi:phosphotransferase system  glucose/maltose/N-acetylglucosamine-specific IIC component
MLDLLVLGIIPGTQAQLNFYYYVIGIALLVIVILSFYLLIRTRYTHVYSEQDFFNAISL